MLVAAPDTRQGQRFFREVGPEHNFALEVYCSRVQALFDLPMPIKEGTRNELSPRRLTLSTEARSAWIDFSDSVEVKLSRGEFEPISGFAAKLENMLYA